MFLRFELNTELFVTNITIKLNSINVGAAIVTSRVLLIHSYIILATCPAFARVHYIICFSEVCVLILSDVFINIVII